MSPLVTRMHLLADHLEHLALLAECDAANTKSKKKRRRHLAVAQAHWDDANKLRAELHHDN